MINTKGGVGKTTTAICMAELSRGRTVLVDATQDKNLKAYYQVPPKKRKHKIRENLDLISISSSPGLRSALPYPFVIIDTQPFLNELTFHIAKNSDIIIIPCIYDLWAIESAKICIEALSRYSQRICLLPTKYRWYWKKHHQRFGVMREMIGIEMLEPIPFIRSVENISFDGTISNTNILKYYRKSLEGFYETIL